jgi:hypothetical protein
VSCAGRFLGPSDPPPWFAAINPSAVSDGLALKEAAMKRGTRLELTTSTLAPALAVIDEKGDLWFVGRI